MRRKILAVALALLVLPLAGCFESDADVASRNLSKAAEQFEVPRRVVAFNGITDKYLLVVEGFCSIESGEGTGVANALEITCKVEDGFRKHYVGLSDNVSYFVQQGKPTNVSTTRHRVIFKPETIIPNFDRP
jgi:hypothetical protein